MEDDRVFLHGVSWDDFERILAIRGESNGVRMTYLEGELELMSPSREHEGLGECLGRLLEAFAEESDLELNSFGSWTIKKKREDRGVEPDKCYILGPTGKKKRPDLAIEVIWTRGGIDKLEVYCGLDVPEVWLWDDGRLALYALRDGRYRSIQKSEIITNLDLDLLLRHVDPEHQTRAVKKYRAALRGEARTGSA